MRSVTPMLLLESSMLNRCEHFRHCSSAGSTRFDAQQRLRERVVTVEQIAVERAELVARHVDLAEHVLRLLDLLAQPHVAVLHAGRPLEVVHAVDALQHHRDPLEAVGQLGGDRRQLDAAGLLEVGELRDLQAVEHHLPADAPRAERRRLPVVLLEPDVVLPRVDAARLEALEVQLLHFVGRRLEDHLELVVLEQAVRVLAEPAVGRAAATAARRRRSSARGRARAGTSRGASCRRRPRRRAAAAAAHPREAQNSDSFRIRS